MGRSRHVTWTCDSHKSFGALSSYDQTLRSSSNDGSRVVRFSSVRLILGNVERERDLSRKHDRTHTPSRVPCKQSNRHCIQFGSFEHWKVLSACCLNFLRVGCARLNSMSWTCEGTPPTTEDPKVVCMKYANVVHSDCSHHGAPVAKHVMKA